jgi:uncharacterized protein (DUF2141 family)
MKTLIISIVLSLSGYLLTAQTDAGTVVDGTTITVTVPVRSSEGNVLFGLYEEANFMKNPTVGLEGEIVEGVATVTFTNIKPGTYAITLVHDKNLNKRMDFDEHGMPTEMYGVSNNVMSMGPPLWSDAKFEVSNIPLELEIRL